MSLYLTKIPNDFGHFIYTESCRLKLRYWDQVVPYPRTAGYPLLNFLK